MIEIACVAVGPTVFEGDDAAVLWAVDHVLTNRRIDPATQRMLGEGVMHDAEPGAMPIAGWRSRSAYAGYTP